LALNNNLSLIPNKPGRIWIILFSSGSIALDMFYNRCIHCQYISEVLQQILKLIQDHLHMVLSWRYGCRHSLSHGSYKYLGINFTISSSFTDTKTHLYNRGLKALYEISKCLKAKNLNLKTIIHLFDHTVNLRWTCSCFKLLNSFEIKLFFPSLNFFPIKGPQISLPYNNTGFTVWSNKWIIVFLVWLFVSKHLVSHFIKSFKSSVV
jgi:hypothetical protein